MERAFEIEFVRQAIYQTLLKEHLLNPSDYIGGVNEVALTSFYEHLQSNEEIDRYVETIRDLNDQQNRTGLIANGTIVSPSNTGITNLNQATIIPMDFTVNFRCTLANRDMVKNSLEHTNSILRGRKVDIAQLDTGKVFMVGTIANNSIGVPLVKNGDYIGETTYTNIDTYIGTKKTELETLGLTFENYTNGSFIVGSYFYFKDTSNGKLCVAVYDYDEIALANKWNKTEEVNKYQNIIFPPEHNSFTKWCLSISFETSRCSEPRTLNAEDYCDISFGGSATLVNESVMLGNQLSKLGVKRYKAPTSDNETLTALDNNYTWLEPLEMPSGNNAETQMNQLISNKFVNNSHTNSISLSLQYTFVIDESIELLKDFFKYARYGIQDKTTPNTIYYMKEIYSKWGEIDIYNFKTKIVESIDIENTESDTMTISLPMQIQGDNN